MQIKIIANDRGNPPGKLADAEIHFTPEDGILSGLKLIGFGIWERRQSNRPHNITFPARQYSVNGERRSFALLRPIEHFDAQDGIRTAILAEYDAYEHGQTRNTAPITPSQVRAAYETPAAVQRSTTTEERPIGRYSNTDDDRAGFDF